MKDLITELQDARSSFDLEPIMLRIAQSLGRNEAARAIEPYLMEDDWLTRRAAAFAFCFVSGPAPDSLVSALGGSEVSEFVLAGGGDTMVAPLEDAVRDAAAYALACMGDKRSVPRLVRMLRWQDTLNSRRFRGSEYREFSQEAASLAPQSADQVSDLYGPVVEHLLKRLGVAAQDFIIRSLNYGGLMNELLCGPLMLDNWRPANATEEFFLFLADDCRTSSERERLLDSGNFLSSFDERDISSSTLVRSLISQANDHDYHLRSAFAPLVCRGTVPLWRELSRASEYAPREVRALRACLSDLLSRYGRQVAKSVSAGIQEALN